MVPPTFKLPLLSPVLVLLCCLDLASCTVDADLGEDLPGSFRIVVETPATLHDKLDLLFVIDNSDNMEARQKQLATSFDSLFRQLSFGRGMPDLHVGVVSTDMGTGTYASENSSCSPQGNSGHFIAEAAQRCGLQGEDFISVQQGPNDTILANFQGTLSEKLDCMTTLGSQGCEFEQPLEAMRSSLRHSINDNLGFLRPAATLGVVLLTDEDDCSTFNPELFNPDNPQFQSTDPNFRCFQSGVICEGDDVDTPGLRSNCQPRTRSKYSVDVDEYVQFVDALKADSKDVVLSAIIGDPQYVGVEIDDVGMDPQLMAACKDSSGTTAYPGVRLGAFVDAFSEQGQKTSLCDGVPKAAFNNMVRKLRKSMGTTCLEGLITDIDIEAPGRQIDCRVYEHPEQTPADKRFFSVCDTPGDLAHSSTLPCYAIQTGGEACGDFRTQLALQIYGRSTQVSPGTRLVAECRVDEF